MRRLLLAERDAHVDDLIARGVSASDEWVALGPSAMHALSTAGLTFGTPEDFSPGGALVAEVDRLQDRLPALCDALDEALRRRGGAASAASPFTDSIYPLMVVLHSAAMRVFHLAAFRLRNPDAKIVVHAGPALAPVAGLLFHPRETLWGRAAESCALGDVEVIPISGPVAARPSPRERIAAWARRRAGTVTLARFARARSMELVLSLARPGDRVVIPDGAPDWLAAAPALAKSGLRPTFTLLPEFVADPGAADDDPDFRAVLQAHADAFAIAGHSVLPLVRDRLAAVWRNGVAATRSGAEAFERLHARRRVSAVLRTSSSSPVDYGFNRAASAAGVPVVVWQHGMTFVSGGRISQMRDFADMMTADVTLAYGSGPASAYAAASARFPKAQIVTLGSAAIESHCSIALPRRSGPPRVALVTTNYVGNDWSLGYSPGLDDRLLFRDQETILDELLTLSGERSIEVCVKLHPNLSHGEPPWVARASREGIRVIRGATPFRACLEWADAVVLDFPSTTLLQALAARRPTFVLTRFARMAEGDESILRRSALASSSARDVALAVGAFARSGRFDANPGDETFLRRFGAANEGAARRAAQLVGEIVRHKQSIPSGTARSAGGEVA